MKRRFLSFTLVLVMLLSCMPIFAHAADHAANTLSVAEGGVYAGYGKGNDFTGVDSFALYNPLGIDNIDPNDPAADFSFWHFVDTSKQAQYAEISFKKADGTTVEWTVPTAKANQHYAVITPSDWMLLGGTSYSTGSGNFNLSHSGQHEPQLGTVTVIADAEQFYDQITPYEDYERDVNEYYTRTADEFYTRSVDESYTRSVDTFYERDVHKVYSRPVYEFYVRNAQKRFVPVFAKTVNSLTGTLVTRLTYTDAGKKSTPVNGGAFKNGHTYVAVDVKKAGAEGGVWYTIADSSKNNGKKTPAEYNRPIAYQYNVQIKDGKLTISFDENFVSASVGAYVAASAGKDGANFPGNAPKHYAGGVTVDLPANCGDVVYLYTHFESLAWYADNGAYHFVGWEYKDTVFGEYYLDDTQYGEYALADTQYGEYELVDTQYGEYALVDTQYGEYELADTQYGEYELADTRYGEYELAKAWSETERIDAAYEGGLTLTVDGEEKPLGEAFTLTPGAYSFVLSSDTDAFAPITRTVTIASGDDKTVDFGTVSIQTADVTLDAVKHYKERDAEGHYADLEAEKHYADREAERHYADLEAEAHYADREAAESRIDGAAEKSYDEEYIYLADLYLGNETDPYGEHAIRRN